MRVGDFVRARCTQLGMTLSELAERAQLTRMHLHRLVNGRVHDPGIRTLHALADAMRLPPVSVYRLFMADARYVSTELKHASRTHPGDVVMFAGDITVPDYSVVMPGEQFTKTWAIQNVGQTPWPERLLVRQDQELLVARRSPMGTLVPVMETHLGSLGRHLVVPATPPSQVIELSMTFVAPRENCTVASIWRIEDGHGQPVYPDSFFLQVMVTVLGG
jgi:transcriptional regulator with XRE-family HTH domain